MNGKNLAKYLSILGMLSISLGISMAFFNYTRTGEANTLQVGRIAFNSTQNNTITLENFFPTSSNNLNSSNSDTITITITGDTTYSEGIEYKVTLEDVNNTFNDKEVPITLDVVANNLGTRSNDYYTERENKEKIYKLNTGGDAYNGKYLLVGYIPAGETGVNGSIDITAFIDSNKVAITDTIENGPIDVSGYDNGTNDDWITGREVFTTSEWNSFNSSNSLSFKVKVEANEGIWVEPEKFLTMKRLNELNSNPDYASIKESIRSIEFHKDGIVPDNYITSFDVTDSTSDPDKGYITLYILDYGIGNTYKAIVVANDVIYAPENSSNMFRTLDRLESFNSKNFKVDNVTNMNSMFRSCPNLYKIDSLSVWNTSNVTSMNNLFSDVAFIVTHTLNPLKFWNVSNVTSMSYMFYNCSMLQDASVINDWNVNATANFTKMFGGSTSVHPEFTKFPNGTWDENGTFILNV